MKKTVFPENPWKNTTFGWCRYIPYPISWQWTIFWVQPNGIHLIREDSPFQCETGPDPLVEHWPYSFEVPFHSAHSFFAKYSSTFGKNHWFINPLVHDLGLSENRLHQNPVPIILIFPYKNQHIFWGSDAPLNVRWLALWSHADICPWVICWFRHFSMFKFCKPYSTLCFVWKWK